MSVMVHNLSCTSGRVLLIAGSDSSGGAGISRDIETVHAHGLMSCPVITAVTAQTNSAVHAFSSIPASLVQKQIETAFHGNEIKAIKIGMLASAEIVEATASALIRWPDNPLILDPVLRSSSGAELLEHKGIKTLKDNLLPLCTLVTPNLSEAAILTGTSIAQNMAAITHQATILLKMGAANVLIKGGHGTSKDATDILFDAKGGIYQFKGKRIVGEMRGTGCALASAIAVALVKGFSVETSCDRAKKYVSQLFLEHCSSNPP